MGTAENKELVAKIAAGELDLLDCLADEAVWVIPGVGRYEGKDAIRSQLLEPVFDQMESMGSVEVSNVVAEGDCVVVEQQAKDRLTKTGLAYNNTYCIVYRIVDGRIKQVTEYCDTALAHSVFG